MKHNCRRAVVSLLILALLVPLCFGCGGGGDGKVTITIGEINDLTGIVSVALRPLHYAIQDITRYYNDNNIIPGVKLKVVAYDTQFNPAREVLGYDWVKERGAKLVVPILYTTGEALRPFADRDRVVLASLSGTTTLIEPPGWVFCFTSPGHWGMKTLMKWISENQWDYTKGIPRIGFGAYIDPFAQELQEAMAQYCQDNPDKFEWGGGFLVPVGTMAIGAQMEKLKDCDYVASVGLALPQMLKEARGRGHTQTFLDSGGLASTLRWVLDLCGAESLDGTLTQNWTPIWEEPFPIVELATECLREYRPGQAEDIIRENSTYLGGWHEMVAVLQILQAAVEEVGAENFDNQAYYNAAIKYHTSGPLWEGYPQWGFSETKRYLNDDGLLYRFDAKAGKLVRVSEWLPLVKE